MRTGAATVSEPSAGGAPDDEDPSRRSISRTDENMGDEGFARTRAARPTHARRTRRSAILRLFMMTRDATFRPGGAGHELHGICRGFGQERAWWGIFDPSEEPERTPAFPRRPRR